MKTTKIGRAVRFAPFLGMLVLAELVRCQEPTAKNQYFQFQSEIDAYLKEDSTSPPPKGAILFIGSSIFRQWTHLKEQMGPLPLFNRAFGGSRTAEVLYYMDKIVLPYEPRIIVYYCGTNDINASEKPQDIFERFRQFCEKMTVKLPTTRIFFVSINRAPQKKSRWGAVNSTNALVRKYCMASEKRGFIDVYPLLFDKQMNPRLGLYRDDLLHFKDSAYVEFVSVIKPFVEKTWRDMSR